jgi:hypothetical protein
MRYYKVPINKLRNFLTKILVKIKFSSLCLRILDVFPL